LIKTTLKLFKSNSTFKNNYIIVFFVLRQAQSRISAITFIDNEVLAYVFIDKSFAQKHNFSLYQLIYSRRLRDFDNQAILIDDIIYVVETIMNLED